MICVSAIMSFASVNGQSSGKTGQPKTCFGRRPLTFPGGHKKCDVCIYGRCIRDTKKNIVTVRERYIAVYTYTCGAVIIDICMLVARVFFFLLEGNEIGTTGVMFRVLCKGHRTGNANEPSKRGFLGGRAFSINYIYDMPSVFKNNLMLLQSMDGRRTMRI